jgi:hypothetical protein
MLSPSCTVYVCVYVRARVRAAVSMLCLPDAHEGVGALSQRLRFMLMMETERIDLGVLSACVCLHMCQQQYRVKQRQRQNDTWKDARPRRYFLKGRCSECRVLAGGGRGADTPDAG